MHGLRRLGAVCLAASLCAGCAGSVAGPGRGAAAAPGATARPTTRVLLSKAEGYFFNGRHEEAIAAYAEVIAQDPAQAAAFRGRAAAHAALRRDAAALADYDRAVALDPRFDEAWLGRGLYLYSRGRYAEAIDDFDRAIAIDPRNATALRFKALACEKIGRLREADATRKAYVHCDLQRETGAGGRPPEPVRELKALGLPE